MLSTYYVGYAFMSALIIQSWVVIYFRGKLGFLTLSWLLSCNNKHNNLPNTWFWTFDLWGYAEDELILAEGFKALKTKTNEAEVTVKRIFWLLPRHKFQNGCFVLYLFIHVFLFITFSFYLWGRGTQYWLL